MAEPNNEGIPYLMALRRGIASDAASAAVQALSSDAQLEDQTGSSSPPVKGAEKRRSPRYKCEGSAEIQLPEHEGRTWATFIDVSLHGCYLESRATYPEGTLLRLKLEANSICVETAGTVRVSYPHLGMGIVFTEMSAGNRACLQRLLETISHPCVIMGPEVATSLASSEPIREVPLISNAPAAIQELLDFFEGGQMLMRDDFFRILQKSQQ